MVNLKKKFPFFPCEFVASPKAFKMNQSRDVNALLTYSGISRHK